MSTRSVEVNNSNPKFKNYTLDVTLKTRLLIFVGAVLCAGWVFENMTSESGEHFASDTPVVAFATEDAMQGNDDGEFYAFQKSPFEARQAAFMAEKKWESQDVAEPKVELGKNDSVAQRIPTSAFEERKIANQLSANSYNGNQLNKNAAGQHTPNAQAVNKSGKRYPLSHASATMSTTPNASPSQSNDNSVNSLLSEPQQDLGILELDGPLNQTPPKLDPTATVRKVEAPDYSNNEIMFEPLPEPKVANQNQRGSTQAQQAPKPRTELSITGKTALPEDNQFRVARAAKPTAKTPPAKKDKTPHALVGAENYVLAEQPQLGDHWKDDRPIVDKRAALVEGGYHGFSPDPIDHNLIYEPYPQMQVYEGKTLNSNQRPILELGRPWYQLGQLSPGYSFFGKHNNIAPQFLLYGDVRTAYASNTQDGDSVSQIAIEANLDFDLKLTGTERFHMFMSPFDDGTNTRLLLDDDEFVDNFDADIDFGYFEGDLGAIVGGFTNQTLPFDMPFAVGVMPLLFQNGVWMEDAFLGIAATIPARNSPKFNISNMDFTFFAGYDKISSDAFPGDDSAARMYGMASFIEAMNGYFEIDYAFLDDRTFDNRSYHNFGFGFTRRYGRLISNSTRIIVNAGQDSSQVANTADGVLLLSENSLITSSPSTLIPYANFFAGFDRPQSAARAGAAGGVLRNTGILFESDGMTGYPTLDATANDTFGGALGINLLADDFSQQIVVEMAMLGVMNEDANRNAPGPQYGLGFRYQLPLTNAIIFRADGMYGFLEDKEDVHGVRLELRHKY